MISKAAAMNIIEIILAVANPGQYQKPCQLATYLLLKVNQQELLNTHICKYSALYIVKIMHRTNEQKQLACRVFLLLHTIVLQK